MEAQESPKLLVRVQILAPLPKFNGDSIWILMNILKKDPLPFGIR